jgi:type II secretion system protein G
MYFNERSFKHKKSNSGFTLLELLVVIAIIGVLASIIISAVSRVRASARDAKRISDFKQIQNALVLYNIDNGKYPIYLGSNQLKSYGDTNWFPELQKYFPGGQIPTSPSGSWSNACSSVSKPPGATNQEICGNESLQTCDGNQLYIYQSSLDGSNYLLFTFLENRKNSNVNWCTGIGSPCTITGMYNGWGQNYIVHGPDPIRMIDQYGGMMLQGKLPCD